MSFLALRHFVPLSILLTICSVQSIAQWQQSHGPYAGAITSLTTAESNIIAGTQDGLFFLSTNAGKDWNRVEALQSSMMISSLVSSGQKVFAGTNGNSLLTSTDAGHTWGYPKNNDFYRQTVRSLALNGSTLYAGTSSGLYTSSDDGDNWLPVELGIKGLDVRTISSSGNHMICGTYNNGVYVSTDSGKSWKNGSPGPFDYRITSSLISDTGLFVGTPSGIYSSQAGSGSWTKCLLVASDSNIRAMFLNASTIYAGTHSGVYASNDGGASWVCVNGTITNTMINCFTQVNSQLYAGSDLGVFCFDDQSSSWTAKGVAASAVTSLLKVDTMLYATCANNLGFVCSSDQGNSWLPRNSGLGDTVTRGLCLYHSTLFIGTLAHGVYSSTDLGLHWVHSGLDAKQIRYLCSDDHNIFAGTNANGVYHSSDGGQSWSSISSSLSHTKVECMAIDHDSLYVSFYAGMYKTSDYGKTWQKLGWENRTVTALWAANGIVKAYEYGSGFTISNDGAKTWQNHNDGLRAGGSASALKVSDPNIFIGTYTGMFLSTNSGLRWLSINEGLMQGVNRFVYSDSSIISIEVDKDFIYAGTSTRGVLRRPLSEIIDAIELPSGLSSVNNILSARPNPLENSTVLNFTLDRPQNVSLNIFNSLGVAIRRTDFGLMDSGTHAYTWSADAVATGVYYCELCYDTYHTVLRLLKTTD